MFFAETSAYYGDDTYDDVECTFLLKEPTVFQVVFDDDICDCVEDELDVVGVGGASEMRVHLFLVFAPVQVLKFHLDIGRRVVIRVGT